MCGIVIANKGLPIEGVELEKYVSWLVDNRAGDGAGITWTSTEEDGKTSAESVKSPDWDRDFSPLMGAMFSTALETSTNGMAFLHVRKASVGGVSMSGTHPIQFGESEWNHRHVKLPNKDFVWAYNKDPMGVLIHNGTMPMTNLATAKLVLGSMTTGLDGWDILGMTDTQVMAQFAKLKGQISHNMFPLLGDFGVAVTLDVTQNTVEIFKGSSRPLFVGYWDRDTWIVASTFTPEMADNMEKVAKVPSWGWDLDYLLEYGWDNPLKSQEVKGELGKVNNPVVTTSSWKGGV